MEPTRTEPASGPAVTAPGPAPAGRARPALPVRPRTLPERHSVRAQVLAALRDALATGELQPGGTYSAPLLAERYGVSATPVREAMQQLVSEGVVETVPNRGFRVAANSPRDLAELAEVRADLEVPAVLRLARSLPRERWDELSPLAEATVTAAAAGDRAAYAEADLGFHRALLALTGNRQLVRVAGELHRKAQTPAAGRRPPEAAELVASAAEHQQLLDALRQGEFATAERLVRAHLAGTAAPERATP
ncbi:GntR family transcriptional regulator [Streptomyces hoynatensis]|uniref:GntR family transcriptional regulator n=1 Tax=Streptomyces hoynatensis TaxID=1141874 RepID=A0A3A9YQM8_9ACTN|nr:GntR family transcriptional regulator [Streptomyces hoynatensis]RKN38293.1 GntR family transcriptional regulator [Streptomyces hoynatensis]